MDRGWMYLGNRTSNEYLAGVVEFLKAAEQNVVDTNDPWVPCPCCDCQNIKCFTNITQIQTHLIKRGFVAGYECWTNHGEQRIIGEEQSPGDQCHGNEDAVMDDNVQINTIFQSTRQEVPKSDHTSPGKPHGERDRIAQMLRDFEEGYKDDKMYQKHLGMIDDSEKPMYPGCKPHYTKLTTVLELLQMKGKYGWSDKSVTVLLTFLSDLLPEGNHMPLSTYKAKRIVCPLGMEVQRIHACRNDCILYRGEKYMNLRECPECRAPRFKVPKDQDMSEIENSSDDEMDTDQAKKKRPGRKDIPVKVCWYLPIVPRLKRLFANPDTAKLMRWHADERIDDDKLRHPADSPQWRNIDRIFYEKFGNDPRNVRFALSTDGMNPFGNMSTTHSTWPVNLSIYNLPPWLCMKRKYIMLAILIQGPKQPGDDIDVYFAPLVDDLKLLWDEGVKVYDAYLREHFTLRCLLFITINDYPAFGNTSGQATKGFNACVQCLENTASRSLKRCKKIVYMRHRRFLPKKHPYRRMKEKFDNTVENDLAPPVLSGAQIYAQLKHLKVVHGKRKFKRKGKGKAKANVKAAKGRDKENGKENEKGPAAPKTKPVWKRKSIFWEQLSYWKFLEVRHSIDVMHVEKNVCDSILGTLLNMKDKTKDSANARLEAMELRTGKLPAEDDAPGKLSSVSYVLEKREAREVCESLYGISFPTGYAANYKRIVSKKENKVMGMKSHDCHVMMTQTLPVVIRNVLTPHVRQTLTKLCEFFNIISRKVIDPTMLDDLQKNVVETLCTLETIFPPSFFDIMVHLIVHLVHEIKMCGPVYLRSMYPFERYMGILKHYVRNRARPEGSIVEGYVTEEVVEFCLDYMERIDPIGLPRSVHKGKLNGYGTVGKTKISPLASEYAQAHFTVLKHMEVVTPYMEEHIAHLQKMYPNRRSVDRLHASQFNSWFAKRVIDVGDKDPIVTALAAGPTWEVRQYQVYKINGYTFATRKKDTTTVTQNSGVCLDALEADDQKRTYYGYIEEIWEMDYMDFKFALFHCQWVSNHQVNPTDSGQITVNLDRVAYKDDPFVPADLVHQVFYIVDPKNKKRHVVMPSKRSIMGVDGVASEEDYNTIDVIPSSFYSVTQRYEDEALPDEP